jgi:hypothetical protein
MNRFFINSIFIAMCFFSTLLCLSNNNTVDSLKLILNNKKQKDSSDVYYYNLIFIEFFNKSFYDSALIYSDSAYALSQLLNYTKGKATSSLNIGAANMRKGNYDVAIESFLSC